MVHLLSEPDTVQWRDLAIHFERGVFCGKRTETGERNFPALCEEKKTWPPNGCSPVRWLVIGILAILGTFLLSGAVDGVCKLLQFPDGSAYGYLPDYLGTMLGFAASFWWTVFLIHKLARTSFRDFVLGSGGCQHRLTGQTYAELSLP